MRRLENKVAVITGGAGGIGAATAQRLVAEGASVVIADIDEARAREVAGEFGKHGLAIACRAEDTDSIKASDRCRRRAFRSSRYSAQQRGTYCAGVATSGLDRDRYSFRNLGYDAQHQSAQLSGRLQICDSLHAQERRRFDYQHRVGVRVGRGSEPHSIRHFEGRHHCDDEVCCNAIRTSGNPLQFDFTGLDRDPGCGTHGA